MSESRLGHPVRIVDLSGDGTGPWRLFVGDYGVADWPPGKAAAEDPKAYAEEVARCVSEALEAFEETERENDHLRQLLDRAHDVMVTVMNDIVTTRGRIAKEKYRRRYRAAGSCVVCGAEAQKDRSRCLDCARKNSACVKRRRATRAA